MTQRVESHIFRNGCYDNLLWLSKNLYNYVNFIYRQAFIQRHEDIPDYLDLIQRERFISEYSLINRLVKLNQKDYRSLPAQTAQQVVLQGSKSWKSFFKAFKAYQKNPSKFTGKPKMPRYKEKDGRNLVVFTCQQVKIKDNFIHFPKISGLKPIKTLQNSLKQIRIVPQYSCVKVEVIYEKEVKSCESKGILGIDLGINNLVTSVDDSGKTFIIKGKLLKSINQFYNKEKARLMNFVGTIGTSDRIEKLTFKRNNKIKDYLHKTSRKLIDYCLLNGIGKIIIGKNPLWKQEINIGKRNNQNFVQIPHAKLIEMISYKAEDFGIEVITHEESYTSKTDSLALEPIKKQDIYLGRRKKRGLFQSSIGKLINADINGSINIIRKAVGDSCVSKIISRGLVFRPFSLEINY